MRHAARRNTSRFRSLVGMRSRDSRFGILPATPGKALLVLLALVAGLIVLAVFADPYVRDIRDALPEALEPLFEFFNWLGEGLWIYVLCVVMIVVSLVRDIGEHPVRTRAQDLTRVAASFYVLAAVVVAGLMASLLKFVIGRARPKLFEEHGHLAFDMFGPGSSWASFPSGHTTTIMSCAVALALLFPRARIPLLIAGLVIAFGRVATGAHYPSDILGGVALGAVVSWLFARALARRRIVFRFDGQGRLRPLHYIGRAFLYSSPKWRGRVAAKPRPGEGVRTIEGS